MAPSQFLEMYYDIKKLSRIYRPVFPKLLTSIRRTRRGKYFKGVPERQLRLDLALDTTDMFRRLLTDKFWCDVFHAVVAVSLSKCLGLACVRPVYAFCVPALSLRARPGS